MSIETTLKCSVIQLRARSVTGDGVKTCGSNAADTGYCKGIDDPKLL